MGFDPFDHVFCTCPKDLRRETKTKRDGGEDKTALEL